MPQAASSSKELDPPLFSSWHTYLLRTMCFRVPPSTLPTVVRDGQVSSKPLLNILWEKEVFFLLSQFHLNWFTGSTQRT